MSKCYVSYRQGVIRLTGDVELIIRHFKNGKIEIIMHEDHELGTKTELTEEAADDLRWLFDPDASD